MENHLLTPQNLHPTFLEEMHSKVEYIVALGIASMVEGKRIVIGSGHFIFDDEKCVIPEGEEALYESRPEEYSHIYMALDGKLVAILCIQDPLRPEASAVLQDLRKAGFKHLVMMTGDSERTAAAVAAKIGVDKFYAEVLPKDKARFVKEAKASGHRVVMVGDGINDSPALLYNGSTIAISLHSMTDLMEA